MTDLLDDIIDYFISKRLVVEGTAFTDTMPNKPDEALAVYEYEGSAGIAQSGVFNRSIQIVYRAETSTKAKLKARELFKALETDNHIINLTDERWCMVYLRQPPFRIKIDSQERQYFGFNIGVTTYID